MAEAKYNYYYSAQLMFFWKSGQKKSEMILFLWFLAFQKPFSEEAEAKYNYYYSRSSSPRTQFRPAQIQLDNPPPPATEVSYSPT